MAQAEVKVTRVFYENEKALTRYIANEGGTRSTKTYSLCQLFIKKMMDLSEEGVTISVVRKTFPSLKSTAMKDFFTILKEIGVYDEANHNKTDETYIIGKSEICFFSTDQPQKLRGRKQDYAWINEANEITSEDFLQIKMRTSKQIFFDYNPSMETSWIYDQVLSDPSCTLIRSTYKDNPTLGAEQLAEIEKLQFQDETLWKIYGLGERAVSKVTIYSNYETSTSCMPENIDEYFYGLDFGFNNPSALVRVGIKDNELYLEEMIYESGLTNADLMKKVDSLCKEKNPIIYADCAEPQRIEEFERYERKSGQFNIYPANKSVKDGIDFVKRYRLHVIDSSVNLVKEIRQYKWKTDRNGIVMEEPVKFMDHALDAMRYAIYTHLLDSSNTRLTFAAVSW